MLTTFILSFFKLSPITSLQTGLKLAKGRAHFCTFY